MAIEESQSGVTRASFSTALLCCCCFHPVFRKSLNRDRIPIHVRSACRRKWASKSQISLTDGWHASKLTFVTSFPDGASVNVVFIFVVRLSDEVCLHFCLCLVPFSLPWEAGEKSWREISSRVCKESDVFKAWKPEVNSFCVKYESRAKRERVGASRTSLPRVRLRV